MRAAPIALLATLALGLPAWPQVGVLAGPPDEPVEIEADTLTYDWGAQVLNLEGHVVARRSGGIVRAATGTLDRANGILALQGGVLGVQGKDVFLADEAVVDLNARTADLTKAVLYLKDRPPNPANPTAGRNTLIVRGKRVRRIESGYVAQDVTVTPCDCAGEPDYEIVADSARIDEDRAHLSGAHLRLFGASTPLFPLSLPMTNRQWGLLAPQFGFNTAFGFTYAQPVFVPLGRSFDVTLTPGWFTGGTTHTIRDANGAVIGVPQGARAIKGPRLGLEFRYAPIEGSTGTIAFDLYDDLDQRDTPGGRGLNGVRGTVRLNHRTLFSDGAFAIDGIGATDIMALRDQQPTSLETFQDVLRTDVGLWRSRGALSAGADATLMQDVRIANGSFPDRRLFGAEKISTFQRLPSLFGQLAPVPLGPGTFSAEGSVAQFATLVPVSAQERTTGFGPTDAGQPGTPLGSDGSRAPALRVDLSPRFAVAGGGALDLRAEAGARVDGWLLEGRGDLNRARAYGIFGASAGLPLERQFGTVLHRVEPQLAVRALTRPAQSGGPPIGDLTDAGGAMFASNPEAAKQGLGGGVPAVRRAYDEIDFAAPVSGEVEATAGLEQSLWTRSGATVVRSAALNLEQDMLLWTHGGKARLGEASAAVGGTVGPVNAGASVRYDWTLRAVSAVGGAAGVHDARGDEVHASLGVLRQNSSEQLRAGIDELFSAARYDVAAGDLAGSAAAGASAAIPGTGMRVGYGVTWTLATGLPPTFPNVYHSASLTLETSCKCAAVVLLLGYPFHDLTLIRDPADTFFGQVHRYLPDFSFRLDLKSLGSIGTF